VIFTGALAFLKGVFIMNETVTIWIPEKVFDIISAAGMRSGRTITDAVSQAIKMSAFDKWAFATKIRGISKIDIPVKINIAKLHPQSRAIINKRCDTMKRNSAEIIRSAVMDYADTLSRR